MQILWKRNTNGVFYVNKNEKGGIHLFLIDYVLMEQFMSDQDFGEACVSLVVRRKGLVKNGLLGGLGCPWHQKKHHLSVSYILV